MPGTFQEGREREEMWEGKNLEPWIVEHRKKKPKTCIKERLQSDIREMKLRMTTT